MDFSLSALFTGFFFSVWGMYFFKQAKDQANIWLGLIAFFLFVVCYGIENLYLAWCLGLTLLYIGFRLRLS